MLESYRPLIWVWTAVLALSAAGVMTLQILGPPGERGLRQERPQTVAPPLPTRADQPVAAASLPPPARADQPVAAASLLPPAAVETPVIALPMPAVPAQPSHRRTRSWVRRGASPRVLDDRGIGDDSFLAERGQSGPQPGPVPPARDAVPLPPAPNASPQASAYQHVAGYIGIFATSRDGTRVFRATP